VIAHALRGQFGIELRPYVNVKGDVVNVAHHRECRSRALVVMLRRRLKIVA
jgi:hypothetical protein